jgi:3(or 17)beta-hydroxysteroid dehydrogenase
MGRVEGKIAIVTGSGTGIGRATALRLAGEGATLVITDMDMAAGETVVGEIGDTANFVQQDVREEGDWRRLMDDTLSRHGRLDILVNNAGILATENLQELESTELDQWRAIQCVNTEGVFLGCKYGVEAMRANGGGSIVNLSSMAALVGTPHLVAYGASKGAVRQLTKSVALHCGSRGYGIRCNSVHPGLIETRMGDQVMALGNGDIERNKEARRRMVPLGELGRPDDVANCILFLASDDARYVTGAELVVDGGYTAA